MGQRNEIHGIPVPYNNFIPCCTFNKHPSRANLRAMKVWILSYQVLSLYIVTLQKPL